EAAEAEGHGAALQGEDPGDVHAAVAAAAADRLRENAVTARRLDRERRARVEAVAPRHDVAVAHDRHGPRIGACATVATDAARERELRIAAHVAGHVQRAVAATAADRLRQDAVRAAARGLDVARVLDRHVAAPVAGAAESPDAEHARAGFALRLRLRREAAGDVDAAVAAAAADRLGEDAGRPAARGRDRRRGRDADVAGAAAVAAETADA